MPAFCLTRRVLKANRLRTGSKLIAAVPWAFSPAPLLALLTLACGMYNRISDKHRYAQLSSFVRHARTWAVSVSGVSRDGLEVNMG